MNKLVFCLILLLTIKQGLSQTNFTDLVKRTEKSVVTVSTFDKDSLPLKIGSAFFIDESGILISNLHVFLHAYSAKIKTWDGKEFDFQTKLSMDEKLDLIKFNISNPTNVKFLKVEIDNSSPLKGEDIFVIGTPGGFESTVSKGIVSAIRDVPDEGRYFQITAPISPGSSGSPVFNMHGKVFGVATLQYVEGQNLNFAIDIKLISKLPEESSSITSITNINSLPDDKTEAIRKIDVTIYPLSDKLNLINDYINKYPNDYLGYLKRAIVYSADFYIYSPDIWPYNEQRATECLLLSDKDFTKALQLTTERSKIYYYRGVSKYNNISHLVPQLIGWDLNGALSDFNKCTITEKGFVSPYEDNNNKCEYIGDIKRDLNDFYGALIAYKQAIQVNPERKRIYQLYGKCATIYYLEQNDLKKASEYINLAFSKIDISKLRFQDGFVSWDLFALRAKIRYDLSDLSGSLSDLNLLFNECNCIEKANAHNYYLKAAIIYSMDGDPYEVITSLSKAIEYSKDEDSKASYYSLRSLEYYLTKQYQLALIDRNKYFELTSPSKLTADDFKERAKIKDQLKDYMGALKDINKAIELDCKNADYFYYKGTFLSSLNDKHGAIGMYDKAIQLNPKEVQYYIMRGYAKYESNKTGACADWSKAGEMGDYSAYDLIKKYCN